MRIKNNDDLYALIGRLSDDLKKSGAEQCSNNLAESLCISTIAGEILGELRLRLQKLRALDLSSQLHIKEQIDDALLYINSILK